MGRTRTDEFRKDAVKRLQKQAPPEALDEVAAQTRNLREWFREFVVRHAGQRLEVSALANLGKLNRLIARNDAYRQIEPRAAEALHTEKMSQNARTSSLRWRQYRRWLKPEDLLMPIAQAMGDLICEANFERVKNCEGSK